MKRISILMLVFVMVFTCIAVNAEDFSEDQIQWKYTIENEDGTIVETGLIPIPQAGARYSWGGITLNNGQSASFTPAHDYRGLYASAGTNIRTEYSLSRQAYHESSLFRYVSDMMSVSVWTQNATIIGYLRNYTAEQSTYYWGRIKNLSSDPFTINSFSITF